MRRYRDIESYILAVTIMTTMSAYIMMMCPANDVAGPLSEFNAKLLKDNFG